MASIQICFVLLCMCAMLALGSESISTCLQDCMEQFERCKQDCEVADLIKKEICYEALRFCYLMCNRQF
ncbi:hypothetical protein LSAT2_019530 [Lamellibrachia satsuma]|nr:hypothetical protein LSAT2_019530 [Lamellibrachia satsuma]